MTPYAIRDQGGGVYWIDVYDNNWPDDANRHLVVDTSNDTWSYNLGGSSSPYIVTGDAASRSLLMVPLSANPSQAPCPWSASAPLQRTSEPPTSHVWLRGGGQLLITDSQGRQIGYDGDQFVNEIPGAYESVVLGGLGKGLESIYHLPLDAPCTVLVDGQTLAEDATVEVVQYGQGYITSVEDIALEKGGKEELVLASDGSQVAYQAGARQEVNIELVVETPDESRRFKFTGADVRRDQTISVAASGGPGLATLNNKEGGDGAYSFEFKKVRASGAQRFAHGNIELSRKDTHLFDYGQWDGAGPLRLYVDEGSDTINFVPVDLENQAAIQGVAIPPAAQTRLGLPGSMVTFGLEVKNTGEAEDSFDVMLSGNVWPADVAETIGPLAAGGSAKLTVQVEIPAAATAGMRDSASIVVTSQADDTQRASASILAGIRAGVLLLPFTAK